MCWVGFHWAKSINTTDNSLQEDIDKIGSLYRSSPHYNGVLTYKTMNQSLTNDFGVFKHKGRDYDSIGILPLDTSMHIMD